ncbi:MAG: very short patch repair endonuclease [Muribaculaceae bacterium]
MADSMTAEQRSRCMAAVKGKNTKPELMVRKFLFAKGLRYRLHGRKLPGHPDLVFPKFRAVVFVDGCFWHGHEGCRSFRLPSTNTEFWQKKINHNRARDVANSAVLRLMGWRVIRVWECDLRNKLSRETTLRNLYEEIVGKSLPEENRCSFAAEPDAPYGR